ncbi:hypothetical protein GCM10010919_05470 [Alishewanella longhuensis]|uniref:Uncharacterized protein n=1 Tax=Alishewanella longhuensis TaxID=1091037 RepID=A0ABQ3KU27_9ALTE|nr:hypothetical protein [Alishewanella longhuensis]GHG61255.1 hypothetical protein GCM10010919_05470 [Alishewanella longhuensis]
MTSFSIQFFSVLTLLILPAISKASEEQTPATEHIIQLQHAAHVCNDEQEAKRLAANDHLREMAKALVEFKATKYCFIMQPSQLVRLLEHHGNYIKFSLDNKVLYTFTEHLITQQL